ncbi:MAG: hypothetical protein LUF77_01130, partial [Oscillospiraceae bacterium]|nr:hypothetical protein [Oscillospiraceae bacterium]
LHKKYFTKFLEPSGQDEPRRMNKATLHHSADADCVENFQQNKRQSAGILYGFQIFAAKLWRKFSAKCHKANDTISS